MKNYRFGIGFLRSSRSKAFAALAFLCVAVALSALCAFSASAEDKMEKVIDTQGNEISVPSSTLHLQSSARQASLTPADDCTATINYNEMVNYNDPDEPAGSASLRLMGTRTLTGLHEGQELSAWDYVVDIPGFMFFDGWPNKMTVSRNPSDNVYTLNYMRLWNAEYTVNYYLMTGADLSADSWSGALAPKDVEFTKLGSETFTNQKFDKVIKGDAYEYKLDDTYVIDTYPSEIRLGTDPDNNVINVLYAPSSIHLPDSVEIPDDVISDSGSDTTPPDDSQSPDDGTGKDDSSSNGGNADKPADSVQIPDSTIDKEELESKIEGADALNDFFGNGSNAPSTGDPNDNYTIKITDEMLKSPVDKKQAEEAINAFMTGANRTLIIVNSDNRLLAVVSVLAVMAFIAAIVCAVLAWRNRKANS